MDWFERLTGFVETNYHETRARLAIEGRELISRVTGKRHGIGELELVSLNELRASAQGIDHAPGRLRICIAQGDVRRMHQDAAHAGALFQVASQFNLLEMTGPEVTPEHGVTRYQNDHTQGPACAIAAGAATVYRNYFVPVGDGFGQTRERQLDGLAEMGNALAAVVDRPRDNLWTMRNGYALCSAEGLRAIDAHLRAADEATIDYLRALLRIGVHWQVEVTDAPGPDRPAVSQAFCAALPVSYTRIAAASWAAFAGMVLEAAYEATRLAGVLHAQRGGSNVVLLTSLGGGAFGNDARWIDAAMRRALERVVDYDMDVRLVSHGAPSPRVRGVGQGFCLNHPSRFA
jgi:hypothetical protein